MAMFCTECGKHLDDDARFCTECGKPVVGPDGDRPQETDDVQDADVRGGAVETATIAETEEVAADAVPKDGFDLPASALEPMTPEPSSRDTRPGIQATQVMPPVDAGGTVDPQGRVRSGGHSASKTRSSGQGKSRTTIVGICSAAAVVVVAAICALLVLDPFNPDAVIDAKAFPNDVIRGAVLDQLDTDGDGRLSSEEAELVTAVVYTPDGAQFVNQGHEVNVSAIREAIEQHKQDPGQGAGSEMGDGHGPSGNGQQDAEPQEAEGGDEKVFGDEFGPFSNMKTFIATDCGLKSIDLSKMPQVEYVDLRQNPDLVSFDLSQNKDIKVLFCDEGAAITGLDEAGLYYTDLVTSMQMNGRLETVNIQVEYDTHARPVRADDVTYVYDDEGRLAHVQRDGADESAWYEDYSYGANGLLSGASLFWALDINTTVDEYAYGYDDAGRMTQFAVGTSQKGSDAKAFEDAGVYMYSEGKLTAYRGTDSSISFTMDDKGLLSSAFKDLKSSKTNVECAYGTSGALAGLSVSEASLDGSVVSSDYRTEYSEAGLPVSSTVPDDSTSMEVTYGCNADGYINSIQWGGSHAYLSGSTGKLSYVKRVGSLSDRASERYVPVIRPALYARGWNNMQGWSPLQNWFSSTAVELPITMLVEGPLSTIQEQLGTQPNMLLNPNELKLFDYDRDHWTEGLLLSGDQPIEYADVRELLAKAAETAPPLSAQAFLSDPVYGEVVRQYLAAQKDAQAGNSSVFEGEASAYPLIPSSVRMLFDMSAMSKSSTFKDRQRTVDFAFVDLNGDGVNELAVTLPDEYLYATDASDGTKEVNSVAVYGQSGGEPKLIACGGERLQCWVTTSGDVVTYGGGGTYGDYALYGWDGSGFGQIGGIGYVSSGGSSSTYELTEVSPDGAKQTSRVSESSLHAKLQEFNDTIAHAQLDWIPIAIS